MLPAVERQRRAEALHGIQRVSRPFGVIPAEGHRWIFSTTDTSQSWTVRVASGGGWWIDWGDGISERYVGTGADQAVSHTYAAPGTYTIVFAVDRPADLLYLTSIGNGLTGTLPPDLDIYTSLQQLQLPQNSIYGPIPTLDLPALRRIYLYNNDLSGSLPDLSSLGNLITLHFSGNADLGGQLPSFDSLVSVREVYLYACAFSGTIPRFDTMTQVQRAYLFGNNLSGDIPSVSANSVFIGAQWQNNALTGYVASTIATTCTHWDASNNQLPVSAVDQILQDFTTNAANRPATGTIDVSGQSPPAPPTPSVLSAAQAALPNWTIITD